MFHGLSPIRNISYLLPMCCSFWEKCINSQKNGLGCSTPLRWLYCLTVIGCNFVLNDLLHQILISYNGPWFTFSFMHIWWHHDDVIKFKGKSFFLLVIPCFWKKWNHPSNSNFASSISMIIETLRFLTFRFTHTQTSALASNRSCWQKHKRVHYKIMEIEAKTILNVKTLLMFMYPSAFISMSMLINFTFHGSLKY